MGKIKKWSAVLLSGALSLGLCACSSQQAAMSFALDSAKNYCLAESGMTGLADGMPIAGNSEEYGEITENGFQSAAQHPLSTFSADVDTASYSNLRRMLNEGWEIQPDAVRIEEMLNYFHYDYPQPADDAPFSVTTELSGCPWNPDSQLLLIGLQAKEMDYESLPASNLVFLLDVSGSMNEPNKLPLVQSAFRLLTENLRPQDKISIVTYAGEDSVVLEGASGGEPERITAAIEELSAGGSTAGSKGIETAYQLAERYFIKGGNNRVLLATDGDLNVGITSESALTRLIEKKREKGVFLSVLGFGTGNLKDNKLEALADHGNGNYSYIDSLLEAKKVLVEEMGGTLFTVAKDVKLQAEFNPNYVKGYRLIGYENRLLNSEDFEDDTKDAGEIGAGHRVTVLYEIVPQGSPMEIPGAEEAENVSPAGEACMTLSVRYKEPDGEESKLLTYPMGADAYAEAPSGNLKFASAVAEFGMLLRDSKYKGNATYEGLGQFLEENSALLDDGYKEEFYSLVQQSVKSKPNVFKEEEPVFDELEGQISEISDQSLIFGSPDTEAQYGYQVNFSPEIPVINESGEAIAFEDLKAGDWIRVSYSGASTRSLPPQLIGVTCIQVIPPQEVLPEE